jgi:hypothetical protein
MDSNLMLLIPIVGILMGGLIVLIPVAGLTARFALKPVVEAIIRVRAGQGANTAEALSLLERRVALLEQQNRELETALERVSAAKDFDRQLAARSGPG